MKHSSRFIRHIAVIVLALVMILTCLPQTTFAIDTSDTTTITFHANGGYFTEEGLDTVSQTFSKTDILYSWNTPTPLNDNAALTFTGWAASSAATQPDIIAGETKAGDLTDLWAVWSEGIPVTYHINHETVRFIGDEYERVEEITEYHPAGSTFHIGSGPAYDYEKPEGSLWYLRGVSRNEDAASPENTDITLTEPLHLYCIWFEGVKLYFDANGGSFRDAPNGITDKIFELDKTIDLISLWENELSPPDSEKELLGWSRSRSGKDPKRELLTNGSMDGETLYAAWSGSVPVTFHINHKDAWFYDNGKKVDTVTRLFSFGTVLHSKDYDSIPSWDTDDDFLCLDGLSQNPDASEAGDWEITVTEPIDLHCIWHEGVEVYVDAKGGYFDGDPQKTKVLEFFRIDRPTNLLNYWSDRISPPDPDKTLRGFSWFEDGRGPFIEEEYTFTGNDEYKTIYAVWRDVSSVPVTGVSFANDSAAIVFGEIRSFPAAVSPDNAADQRIYYSSDNPSVVSVDNTGKLTAHKVGKATITAITHDGGKKATMEVRVLFKDVTSSSKYYFNPVYWAAYDNGYYRTITEGYTDGTFGVGKDCQRRDALIFMWRCEGCPTKSVNGKAYGDARTFFNDMEAYNTSSAANKAVAWAYKEGIVKGYADGGIHPTAPVVRKDVMIMLYRLKGKPAVTGTLKFSDCQSLTKTSDTYKAILWGSQKGITKGYSSGPYAGQFGVNLNCLREQIITFLYRYKTSGE